MRTNPFGDIRAEHDHEMLEKAFYETPEYRSLLEQKSSRVVVGRRGTGKSALFYMLERHWASASELKQLIILLAPSETEIIGLRPFVALFGSKLSYLRAACSLAWQYAILQEILSELCKHYKVRAESGLEELPTLASGWLAGGQSITSRLFSALESKVDKNEPVEKRIATLARCLDLDNLTALAGRAVDLSKYSLHIMADRLDEGYEPDPVGVAILTGLVHSFAKLSIVVPNTSTIVFLRDNIFRAIQGNDPDYSRNIEGDVLRLHWDEYHLFNMICNRIRGAFDITHEKNLRVWDKVAARDLEGKDGFRRCLRLTLYRPRDLLVLLNSAFNHALSHDREVIVGEDVEESAREISCSRLDDLKKEYREKVIPGIDRLVALFANGKPRLSLAEIADLMVHAITLDNLGPAEGQTFAIFTSPQDIVHILFSVGFLGVWRSTASSYVFCHDGKDPDFSVDANSMFLVHPCYWIALNLKEAVAEEQNAKEIEEIHDEYDIEVSSETPEIRQRNLGQFLSQLSTIPEGDADASRFEDWCLRAINIVFATGIVNAELHPNRNSTQRRDIVGRNTGNTESWRRILDDYSARQVLFEVKNYSTDLGPEEFRQMLSYLCGEHGKIGFIINRSTDPTLQKGRELPWVREIYHEHDHRVIVKLPASLISKWISKLRNPQKHDVPDKGLASLLDTYERMYLRLGGTATSEKPEKPEKPAKRGTGS